MINHILEFKNKIKHYLGQYPKLFFPIYRMVSRPDHIENLLLKDGVEIVVEGFPRSGNTFAVVAFSLAQGRDIKMAHHLHVEAQILRGVELGLPVIVLIRDPRDAIKSLQIRHPKKVRDYAKRYVKFYSAAARVRDHVVFADFRVVTTNFGEIIHRVNEKFSTNFRHFEHSNENVEKVFLKIDCINEIVKGHRLTHTSRPVAEREQYKTSIDLDASYVVEALKLYENLVGKK